MSKILARLHELIDLCNELEIQLRDLGAVLAEKDKEIADLTLKYETLKLSYNLERQRSIQ